jgi:hypothetical protein
MQHVTNIIRNMSLTEIAALAVELDCQERPLARALHKALTDALAARETRTLLDLATGDPVPSQDPSGSAHAASPAAGSDRPAMIPVALSRKELGDVAEALVHAFEHGEPVQLAQDALDNNHVKFKINHGSWSPGFGTTEAERMR